MIALLVFGVGCPAVVFGLMGGQASEVRVGVGVLAACLVGCVVRDVRAYLFETRTPRA